MSGKAGGGGRGGGGKGGGGKGGGGGGGGKVGASTVEQEPTIVEGWQYHQYGGDRYAYIGKNDDGVPEFVDYGRKTK